MRQVLHNMQKQWGSAWLAALPGRCDSVVKPSQIGCIAYAMQGEPWVSYGIGKCQMIACRSASRCHWGILPAQWVPSYQNAYVRMSTQ